MDKESIEQLRFDRRLMRREGWVDPARLEAELESLPDVSAKARLADDAGAESDADAASTADAGDGSGGTAGA